MDHKPHRTEILPPRRIRVPIALMIASGALLWLMVAAVAFMAARLLT